MDGIIQIIIGIIMIGGYGGAGRGANQEGTKKGYDPVGSAINGVRFGLLAVAYYKGLAPDLTKGPKKKEV